MEMHIYFCSHISGDSINITVIDDNGDIYYDKTFYYGIDIAATKSEASVFRMPYMGDVLEEVQNEFHISNEKVFWTHENVFKDNK